MLTTPLLALLYTRMVMASSGVKLLECGVETLFRSCVGAALELDVDATVKADSAANINQFIWVLSIFCILSSAWSESLCALRFVWLHICDLEHLTLKTLARAI